MNVTAMIMAADRPCVLRFLASLLHEITVYARAHYDTPGAGEALVRMNEGVHRLSGHLRDLLDPDEPLTSGRAEAIAAGATLIGDAGLSRILAHSPLD